MCVGYSDANHGANCANGGPNIIPKLGCRFSNALPNTGADVETHV